MICFLRTKFSERFPFVFTSCELGGWARKMDGNVPFGGLYLGNLLLHDLAGLCARALFLIVSTTGLISCVATPRWRRHDFLHEGVWIHV